VPLWQFLFASSFKTVSYQTSLSGDLKQEKVDPWDLMRAIPHHPDKAG